MDLIYEYIPDEILKDVDIYLYGAGTGVSSYSRIAIASLRSINKRPVAFIDDNFLDSSNKLFDINVLTPQIAKNQIEKNKKDHVIIVTSNYFETIFDSILNFGLAKKVYNLTPFKKHITEKSCSGLITYSDAQRKLEAHFSKSKQFERKIKSKDSDQINLAFLDIQLTERCSMKCKDCSNLMQYYEKPIHADHDELVLSLNNLLASIDNLSEARLLGGEPFLYTKIDKVIDILCKSKKVSKIYIYTNGTIKVKYNVIEALKNNKITVEITDYGEKLSRNKDNLINIFQKENINYVCHKPQNWTDSARIVENNLDDNNLSKMFKACCVNDVFTLLHGKLYHCPFSANVVNLKALFASNDEFVDLKDLGTDELKKSLKKFIFGRPYLDACKLCLGRDFTQKIVEPAIQLKKNIPLPTLNKIS